MTRERKKVPASNRGVRALTRRAKMEKAHQTQQQHDDTWRNLNPHKEPPRMKHKTTFELVENSDKKKKLEFEITTDRNPPPGFEFVPLGHPALSHTCKEMSREQDAMIFIVSTRENPDALEHHMNRVGYHYRQRIVEQAREKLVAIGKSFNAPKLHKPGEPEPIPRNQAEIDAQADNVIRDLFPRIPHTDRREIIQHAFRKDGKFHGESRVGMVKELTLARRVQLAALAHIRHTHTRYDELLKETSWANARKAVEKPCLDIIVKWRGDEETGRDQLDEILREVIEITDTEESEDESPTAEPTPAPRASAMPTGVLPRYTAELTQMMPADHQSPAQARRHDLSVPGAPTSSKQKALARAEKRSARKTQRFRRYAAAAEALAGTAGRRSHGDDATVASAPFSTVPVDLTRSPRSVQMLDHSREPTVAAHGTPNVEHVPRHFELRSDLQRLNAGPRRERVPTIPHDYPEANMQASPQRAYNPESYRPKVGHVPNYDRPQTGHSMVRHGLQDMLLQSIEPASPLAPRQSDEVPRTSYGSPQRFVDAPRIVPRAVHEHVDSIPRPWSPAVMSNGNELIAERHRRGNYPPEHADAYTGPPFFKINRQDRGEDHRQMPAEYLPDRQVSFRPIDGGLPHNPPVHSQGMTHYGGDTSTRTRANPIIIDDDAQYRHRPVVEVRRHPGGEYHAPPLRQAEAIPHPPIRRDTRVQNDPQVVYIDTPTTQPRNAFDYRGSAHLPSHRFNPYQKPDAHRVPAPGPRHTINAPVGYEPSHHREPMHNQHQVFARVRSPVNMFRETRAEMRAAPLGLDRPDVRYASTSHHYQERPDFAPLPNMQQDRRDVRYYRIDEHREVAHPQGEHGPNYQPPLIPPPPAEHYMEHYESPLRQHVPERRMVFVGR
ncbi:uncharacterized protein GGS22DRAFT_163375 [Annulohypoxylon maeteangense]|uniref:uncharacterized protein n=1 Tax=Annulohypoxylon maeteangense TaxID=1927788 RepID=UPI0020082CA9|nr:uncharacterized protein GGS22DRAFT_163375 [Annulohypoxylon maeteangense]KAI0885296.1 hypothetical protein GGS22DRAFT_163375 [Annulohypoxylon maeteangense]